MGGSQLKRLKATLKSKGLTGVSSNGKSKNSKKNRPVDFRRQDEEDIKQQIREEFNPFDVKVNRNKHKVVTDTGNKHVVGKPSVSKSKAEEERRLAYEYQKSKKGKNNRIVDKRFGEGDNNLSMEDKMLERFTREKVSNSTLKKSLFNLDDSYSDDDDINGGLQLTHSGKALYRLDDTLGDSNKRYHDGIEENFSEEQPQRKKTKAEIMKEVISKSKFFKHERQKKQQELENKVQDLNEGFEDIMSELLTADAAVTKNSDDESDDENIKRKDKDYKMKYNSLQFQAKSKPTTRTKTEEELAKEYEDNRKRMEDDRLRRMEGMDRDDEVVGDDLGDNEYEDDFWVKNDSDGQNQASSEEGEDEEKEFEDDVEIDTSRIKPSKLNILKCPETHAEFLQMISKDDSIYCISIVQTILKTYQAHLAIGNKQKIANFSKVLLLHILYLADLSETFVETEDYRSYVKTQNELVSILQRLAKKHLVAITEEFRTILDNIEARFVKSLESGKKKNQRNDVPKISDLLFFTLVGILYSTSDYYHLVVTPANTLLGEFLNLVTFSDSYNQNIRNIFSGLYICDLLLNYQRLSKRYIPEVAIFLQQVCIIYSEFEENEDFTCLIPHFRIANDKFKCIDSEDFDDSKSLKISDLNNLAKIPNIEKLLYIKTMNLVQNYSENIWKEKSAFREIIHPFCILLKSYELQISDDLLSLLESLIKFNIHLPLTLQYHKPIAIASYPPKFEVNFNPTKKYDDSGNAELNKLKSQVKKERKLTIRELRKDNKFMARQKIDETKQKYDDYHKKMASIVNSINTIEGKERNQYEKEKRRSKSKK